MINISYDIILFDLDGTIVDSKMGIIKSVNYALLKYDINVADIDELIKFIGPPLIESFAEYYSFDKDKAREAVGYYREYYTEFGIFENEVYDGIPELLGKLKQLKKTLCVATSKPTKFAKIILRNNRLLKYFKLVIGSNMDGSRGSKVEVVREAIKQLGVKNLKQVVMIGDRKHDIVGAKENGIDSIAVKYGYGCIEELEQASPRYFVDNVEKLYELLL